MSKSSILSHFSASLAHPVTLPAISIPLSLIVVDFVDKKYLEMNSRVVFFLLTHKFCEELRHRMANLRTHTFGITLTKTTPRTAFVWSGQMAFKFLFYSGISCFDFIYAVHTMAGQICRTTTFFVSLRLTVKCSVQLFPLFAQNKRTKIG